MDAVDLVLGTVAWQLYRHAWLVGGGYVVLAAVAVPWAIRKAREDGL